MQICCYGDDGSPLNASRVRGIPFKMRVIIIIMTINLAVKIFPSCVCACYNTCVSVGPIVNQFTEFLGLVVYPVIRWMCVRVVGGRVWQYLNVAIRQFGDKRIKRRGGKKRARILIKSWHRFSSRTSRLHNTLPPM